MRKCVELKLVWDVGGVGELGDGLGDFVGGFDVDGVRVDDFGSEGEGEGDGGERDVVCVC